MAVKVVCDFCGKPLPRVITDDGLEYTKYYTTNELNTRSLFPCLCESCAEKLDRIVILARKTWLKEIDISVRNSRINAVRRELLGTKG